MRASVFMDERYALELGGVNHAVAASFNDRAKQNRLHRAAGRPLGAGGLIDLLMSRVRPRASEKA